MANRAPESSAMDRAFKKLPDHEFVSPTSSDTSDDFYHRGISVNLANSPALKSNTGRVYVLADRLIVDADFTITIKPLQAFLISVREIVCKSPRTLTLDFSQQERSAFRISCRRLLGELNLDIAGETRPNTALNFDGLSTASISFEVKPGNAPEAQMSALPDRLDQMPDHFGRLLRTQLQMAIISFWSEPDITIERCSYVEAATAEQDDTDQGRDFHTQAVAIGQQVLANHKVLKNVHQLPVLAVDHYRKSLKAAIEVAHTYQEGYRNFSRAQNDLEDQKKAWDVLLAQAQDNLDEQEVATQLAHERWTDAHDVYQKSRITFRMRAMDLDTAAMDLRHGVEQYKIKVAVDAAMSLLSVIITIGGGAALLVLGAPTAPDPKAMEIEMTEMVAEVEEIATVAETVKEAVEVAEVMGVLVNEIQLLAKGAEEIKKLVPIFQKAAKDPSKKTSMDGKYLTQGYDPLVGGEAAGEASLTAWDQWSFKSDEQVASAVEKGIDGAAKYRSLLKLYALDGKLCCKSQGLTIKTGSEYCLAAVRLKNAKAAVERNQKLRDDFSGQSDKLLEAQLAYFDRLQESRMNILTRMRNVQLANHYETLSNSRVVLDPLKEDIVSYKKDANALVDELEQSLATEASDPQESNFTGFASRLASSRYHELRKFLLDSIIASLKNEQTHQCIFTVSPVSEIETIGNFWRDGHHVRVWGLRAFLIGVKPSEAALTRESKPIVDLEIRTTGLYANIDRHGKITTFSSRPLFRQFQYEIDGNGNINRTKYLIDSILRNKDHINPTPFSQWSVVIKNPKDLDLSGLKDVELEWPGSAYFDRSN